MFFERFVQLFPIAIVTVQWTKHPTNIGEEWQLDSSGGYLKSDAASQVEGLVSFFICADGTRMPVPPPQWEIMWLDVILYSSLF